MNSFMQLIYQFFYPTLLLVLYTGLHYYY